MSDITLEHIRQAQERIRPFLRRTWLEHSASLSKSLDASVYLKVENLQLTGSFKLRGALNKVLQIAEKQPGANIITASTGNHGQAVAYACQQAGLRCTVVLPVAVSSQKLAALQAYDIKIVHHGHDCDVAEGYARQLAEAGEGVYVSPYNDIDVMAGQGTVALEIIEDLPDVDCVIASVGGGGLIAGMATALKAQSKPVSVIGALPERSPVMAESVKVGEIVSWPVGETLSDGTAGGIETDTVTFGPCQRRVDEWVLVSEAEIAQAWRDIMAHQRLVIEGAAAVSVAAARKLAPLLKGKKVVIVLCGGNIAIEKVRGLLNGELGD